MIFGRVQEEIDFLRTKNIPVEIVPGVTAALGAAAELQVYTAVLYMASHEAELVKAELLASGMKPETPVAVAENISLPLGEIRGGRFDELPALAARCSGGPALLVIGKMLAELAAPQRAVDDLSNYPKLTTVL